MNHETKHQGAINALTKEGQSMAEWIEEQREAGTTIEELRAKITEAMTKDPHTGDQ